MSTEKETFCNYFNKWVEEYKSGNVRPVTLQKYHMTLRSLTDLAGDVRLSDLTKTKYQDIINRYALTHEKTTTADFHHHLKACLDDLVDDGIISRNPANKTVIKGKKPTPKKSKFLSQFETQCLIKALKLEGDINYDYLIFLMIKTGLRFSEAVGLTPSDFNFETQTIYINKTFNYKVHGGNGFDKTKNESSIRKIQVDWKTLHMFSEIIKDVPKEEPIFVYGKGHIYNSTVNDLLEQRCKEAGVPVVTLHSLRHTHASLLLAGGVSVASVAQRLGHSNMATTQKVYLHVIKELENKDNALAIASMMNLGE